MSDKVEFDLEDLDDLKDLIGDERKRADFSFQKVFSLSCFPQWGDPNLGLELQADGIQ